MCQLISIKQTAHIDNRAVVYNYAMLMGIMSAANNALAATELEPGRGILFTREGRVKKPQTESFVPN